MTVSDRDFSSKERLVKAFEKASRDPPGSVGELIDDYFGELFPSKKCFPKKFLQGCIGELFPPKFLESVFRANSSSDIFGLNFIFKYLVEFFVGRFVHQTYFLVKLLLKTVLWRFLFRGFVVEMFLPILFW